MPSTGGSYKLGPDNGTLSIRTRKAGAASKAGHNLLIEVTAWTATFELGEDPAHTRIALSADSGSLRVREGSGGMQSLGEDDQATIEQTIDEEVLKGAPIEFRSSGIEAGAGGAQLRVRGELELAGVRRPIDFELTAGADGRIAGTATVKQSEWGIKPYSALFGTLKVVDEVTVEVAVQLPSS